MDQIQQWFREQVFEYRTPEQKLSQDYHQWVNTGQSYSRYELFPQYNQNKWAQKRQKLKAFQQFREESWELRQSITWFQWVQHEKSIREFGQWQMEEPQALKVDFRFILKRPKDRLTESQFQTPKDFRSRFFLESFTFPEKTSIDNQLLGFGISVDKDGYEKLAKVIMTSEEALISGFSSEKAPDEHQSLEIRTINGAQQVAKIRLVVNRDNAHCSGVVLFTASGE